MDAEVATNAVANPVREVETTFPQFSASEAIQRSPERTDREHTLMDRNEALQDPREALALVKSRGSQVHRARDVRGAIEVLRPAVNKVERLCCNHCVLPFPLLAVGGVVNHCRVRVGGRRIRQVSFYVPLHFTRILLTV